MTEIAPQDAKLGDLVFNGSFKGVACGTSNDDAHAGGGTVSVVWSFAPGCDVIGIKSPFWMHYDIVRDEPEPAFGGIDVCEQCGVSYGGHQHDCPNSDLAPVFTLPWGAIDSGSDGNGA